MKSVLLIWKNYLPNRIDLSIRLARGRSDAYAEMGIKALDARMNGETIYCDWDGNVIDEMNVKDFRNFCEENEIEIDDLVTGDE